MKITDRYSSVMDKVSSSGAKPATTKGSSDAAKTGSTASVGEVRISAQALELSKGAGRLEQLKSSVRDGSYKVDSQAIAKRLVGEDS